MGNNRHGKRTQYNGQTYRSMFEASIAAQLTDEGVAFEYEKHEFFYSVPAMYVPDFRLPGGIFVEVKGYFKATDRRKLLEVKDAHPTMDLRLVFQNAFTKLTRRPGSISYGTWATRHGFRWAEQKIPAHWIREAVLKELTK